jgi:hypothetical protein
MALTIGSAGSAAERRPAMRNHVAGLLLGGLTTGLSLAGLGAALRPVADPGSVAVTAVVATLAAGWALTTAVGVGLPYPQSRWQVPEQWRYTLPFPFTVGAYGYLLGLGFLTNTVSAAFWLFVVLSLLVPNTGIVVLAWLLYAATRAVATARGNRRVAACPLDPPSEIYSYAALDGTRWLTTALLAAAALSALS